MDGEWPMTPRDDEWHWPAGQVSIGPRLANHGSLCLGLRSASLRTTANRAVTPSLRQAHSAWPRSGEGTSPASGRVQDVPWTLLESAEAVAHSTRTPSGPRSVSECEVLSRQRPYLFEGNKGQHSELFGPSGWCAVTPELRWALQWILSSVLQIAFSFFLFPPQALVIDRMSWMSTCFGSGSQPKCPQGLRSEIGEISQCFICRYFPVDFEQVYDTYYPTHQFRCLLLGNVPGLFSLLRRIQ